MAPGSTTLSAKSATAFWSLSDGSIFVADAALGAWQELNKYLW